MNAGYEQVVATALDVTTRRLMSVGRSFDGGPVEVLTPQQAFAGRAIAADYLATHELSPKARYECGLAVDKDMRSVPYDSAEARLVGILDMVMVEDQTDEDGGGGIVFVDSDYKTAWPTRGDWLDSVQAMCQTCLLWAEAMRDRDGLGVDGVMVRCVNLRTHGRYDGDVLWLDDTESQDKIDAMWHKLGILMAAAEHTPRTPQPGPQCMGCPYAYMCESCFEMASGDMASGTPGAVIGLVATPAEVVRIYAAMQAKADALKVFAREAVPQGEINLGAGRGAVGFRTNPTRRAAPGVEAGIAAAWHNGGNDTWDSWVGLLRALKIGSGNIEAVGKELHPSRGASSSEDWREQREAFFERSTELRPGTRFGVWPERQTMGIRDDRRIGGNKETDR